MLNNNYNFNNIRHISVPKRRSRKRTYNELQSQPQPQSYVQQSEQISSEMSQPPTKKFRIQEKTNTSNYNSNENVLYFIKI